MYFAHITIDPLQLSNTLHSRCARSGDCLLPYYPVSTHVIITDESHIKQLTEHVDI